MGFSDEELRIAIEQEKALEQKDADHRAFLAAKNSMESFILEMRMAPKRKFGETINASELNEVFLKPFCYMIIDVGLNNFMESCFAGAG